MNDTYQKLKDKGWSNEDINKTVSIIERGETQKPGKIKFLDNAIFWIVMIVAIIGNLVISIMLIPFLLVLKGYILYTIVAVIGLSFGAFFDLIIRDVERLQKRSIIISGLFIPLLAIINISYMVRFTNYLQSTLRLSTVQHNFILVSLVYVIAFMLPYLLKEMMLKTKKTNTI